VNRQLQARHEDYYGYDSSKDRSKDAMPASKMSFDKVCGSLEGRKDMVSVSCISLCFAAGIKIENGSTIYHSSIQSPVDSNKHSTGWLKKKILLHSSLARRFIQTFFTLRMSALEPLFLGVQER
jgi:hypothetical protein